MPAGRPTKYTKELAQKLCSELASGKSMRTVCDMPGMPDRTTVFRWMSDREEFRHQYAEAKEMSAEALAEQMFDIADDGDEDVQRSRLRVDTRKWYLSKIKPKKYGDLQRIDHTSSDGSMSLTDRLSRGRQRAADGESEAD